MSEVLEYTARLSQAIGARPGGTEEEQQASFFIEEVLQKKAGLETQVEEFNCNPDFELPRVVCCIVAALFGVLALFLPLMLIPSFLVSLVAAVLFALEIIGVSPLAKTGHRGVSQNVIARYFPGEAPQNPNDILSLDDGSSSMVLDGGSAGIGRTGGSARSGRGGAGGRKRKIVIVTRYDTGKVRAELKPAFLKVFEWLPWVEIGGCALVPLALLVRIIASAEGPLLVILNTVIIIGVILALIPVLIFALHKTAKWSDGANNNASGVAVMLEVAERIAKSAQAPIAGGLADGKDALQEASQGADGSLAENGRVVAGPDDLVVMHGEEAAIESGMLPAGADLIYDGAEEGMQASAGAVAANTQAGAAAANGQAAAGAVAESVEGDALTQPVGGDAYGAEVPASSARRDSARRSNASVGNAQPGGFQAIGAQPIQPPQPKSDVPDWFRKGIAAANANKDALSTDSHTPVARSRFADALDAAAEASEGSIQEFEARDANRRMNAARENDMRARMSQGVASQSQGAPPWGAPQAVAQTAAQAATQASAAQSQAASQSSAERGETQGSQGPASQLSAQEIIATSNAGISAATTGEISPAVAAAIQEQAADVVRSVEEVAEQAATADRTISFIPVAAEIPSEVSAAEAALSADPVASDALAKTPAEILADANAIADSSEAEFGQGGSSSRKSSKQKRAIALPSLTGAIAAVSAQQDAPLADAAEGKKRARLKDTIASPIAASSPEAHSSAAANTATAVASATNAVASGASATTAANATASKKSAAVNSRAASSSKSSSKSSSTAPAKAAKANSSNKAANASSSASRDFAHNAARSTIAAIPAFGTGSFEPVGNELLAGMAQEDIIIEDVDDSAYETNTTVSGAPAGPSYVEMPKSRASRLRGLFGGRNKNRDDETSFAEAVGIDADFDARKVGAERGGWESFQNESADYDASAAQGGTQSTVQNAVQSTAQGTTQSTTQGAAQSDGKPNGHAAKAAGTKRHSHRGESKSRTPRKREASWDDGAWDEDDWSGGAFSLGRKSRGDNGNASSGRNSEKRSSDGRRHRNSGNNVDQPVDGSQRRRSPGGILEALAQEAADEVNAQESAYAATSGRTRRRNDPKPTRGNPRGNDAHQIDGADEFVGDFQGNAVAGDLASENGSLGDALDGNFAPEGASALAPEDMLDERERIRNFRAKSSPHASFAELAAFASAMNPEADANDAGTTGDMRDLAQPQGFQTEVWFVALGAELANNAGIKAFLADHASEMRGAVIIDIEALGAGTLTLIEEEGVIRRKKASSRMKRYVTKAGSALGLRIGGEKMNWHTSAAYYAAQRGLQTIHIAGMQDGKPAYLSQIDDTMDNIDEDKLLENTAFVLELLHNI